RSLLSSGKLVATGRDSSGKCKTISASEWVDLWPMFATNTATFAPTAVRIDAKAIELVETEESEPRIASRSNGLRHLASARRVEGISGQSEASPRKSGCRLDEKHPAVLDQSDPGR